MQERTASPHQARERVKRASEPEEASSGTPLSIEWREPDGFVWLSVKNFLLKVVTLGIYSFWGRTEVRRRLWNAIRVNGEPLEYTGTGWELFRAFILATLLIGGGIFLYALAIAIITGGNEALMEIFMLPLYVVLFWLMGLAIYRTWRYRLRRTRWRGIRATLAGAPVTYANAYFITSVLVALTLGWLIPWRARELHTIMTNDTRLGSAALRMDPEPALGPLYSAFAALWFGSLIAYGLLILFGAGIAAKLGGIPEIIPSATVQALPVPVLFLLMLATLFLLAWLWFRYSARTANWLTAHIRLHDGHFRLNLTPGGLFTLHLGNFFIALLTLGILLPVVQKRTARYMVENLSFEGTVNLAELAQATDAPGGEGEGLGDLFDIDGL